MPASPALRSYLAAFQAPHDSEPFLTFYPVSPSPSSSSSSSTKTHYTRGELWTLSRQFAHVLKHTLGLQRGDCHLHLFAGNSVEDLALRVAAVMLGTVPVTVNWDSDPLDRIVYKVTSSHAKVVFVHGKTPAEQVVAVKAGAPGVSVVAVEEMVAGAADGDAPPLLLDEAEFDPHVNEEHDTRIIIYTSGSSGEPKGVRLSYQSYVTNRATFESFLQLEDPANRFTPILVNPMHHTNSTALSDWALRRPGTHLHLFERYTTSYWATVAYVALGLDTQKPTEADLNDPLQIQPLITHQQQPPHNLRVICPTVSRHFDFLDTLIQENRLGLPNPDILKWISPVVTFLIGSAPVGPSTVSRLMTYLGKLPTVRFGSTETCLQVMGTPLSLSQEVLLRAFERGWAVGNGGGGEKGGEAAGEQQEQQQPGFYVGRPHPPFTEVRVVHGIDPGDSSTYLQECPEGVKGYLVTRGKNLMKGYVQGEEATNKAIHKESGGWYTNLGDICFWLANAQDGEKDYYWVTRTSNLLIRGGTNYSYDQISGELAKFLASQYHLPSGSFAVAAVGLRVTSEHDDDCLVTVELMESEAQAQQGEIEANFIKEAKAHVSKGAKPSQVRFAAIPRNFKGDINWRALEAAWKDELKKKSK